MLIVLPDEALPEDRELSATVLSNLARAEREGKHLLVVPRGLDLELPLLDIRAAERAQLKHAAQDRAQRASLRGSVSRQVHVQWNIRGSFVAPEQGSDIQIWEVPAAWFQDSNTCQAVHLAGENGDDIELLIALGQAWRDAQARGPRLAFQARPMGGNNFPQLLAPLIQDMLPFLAVADSDKGGADLPLGQTAKGLLEAVKVARSPHEARVLPVRTLENLIPTVLWTQAGAKDPELTRALLPLKAHLSELGSPWTDLGLPKGGLQRLHQWLGSGQAGTRSETDPQMWSEHPLLTELARAVAHWGLAARPRRT